MSPLKCLHLLLGLLLATFTVSVTSYAILYREDFEKVFEVNDELKKLFHTAPYYAVLFVDDGNGYLRTLPGPCLVPLLGRGEAFVPGECIRRVVNPRLEEDPSLTVRDITMLAYRCFKSDNPYDYDLHWVPLDEIASYTLPGMGDTYSISFRLRRTHGKCRFRTTKDVDSDVFMQSLKDKSNSLPSATDGVTPLDKTTFEAAFAGSKRYPITIPYYTFIFQRNMKTMSTELEPMEECRVKLIQDGVGSVHKVCWNTLSTYHLMNENLPNVILPLRCFKQPKDDTTDYELYIVAIEDVFKIGFNDSEQFLISFTTPSSTECTPIWAKDVQEQRHKVVVPADEKERQLYMKSLSKKRFEQAFREIGLDQNFKVLSSMAYLFVASSNTSEKVLVPIVECSAMLYRFNKALIKASCEKTLKLYEKYWTNPLFKDRPSPLFFAYRCYLLYNPLEFEVQFAKVEKMVTEYDLLSFVHFTIDPKPDHCLPVWKEDHPMEKLDSAAYKKQDVDWLMHDEL